MRYGHGHYSSVRIHLIWHMILVVLRRRPQKQTIDSPAGANLVDRAGLTTPTGCDPLCNHGYRHFPESIIANY